MKIRFVLLVLTASLFHPSASPAQWQTNGTPLCTADLHQTNPVIVSDTAGGAIVTWRDYRSSAGGIYAQRISGSGVVQWTPNGVALSSFVGINLTIIADGTGGAIVSWQDTRTGISNNDIYAQRISASGVVQWTANGVALCTAAGNQLFPSMTSDGAGGAIVTWEDHRGGTIADIYAQRVNASGAVQWAANGVALCTEPSNDFYPTIVSDGTGGAIVTWQDGRGATDWNIFAQRISAVGAVQWIVDGVAVCAAALDQTYPMIVSDGAGGAIVAWQDVRSGSSIYAQRVNTSGAVQWTINGVALRTATFDDNYLAIISDGAGGAIVTWFDGGGVSADIYAQRVNASGVVAWAPSGVALCTAVGDQFNPTITSDGTGARS